MKRKSKGELCNCKNVKADDIEPAVLAYLQELSGTKEEYLSRLDEKFYSTKASNNFESEKAAIEKQIQDKQKQINNLVDKLSIDESIEDILINRIKNYKNEIKQLEKDIETIDNKINDSLSYELAKTYILSFFDDCNGIASKPRETQREIINTYVKYITYDPITEKAKLEIYDPLEIKKN